MFDQNGFIDEMQRAAQDAVAVMLRDHCEAIVYSISTWTDVDSRKSAVSFDTFENSEATCSTINATWRQLRERFAAEGNVKRLALIPADTRRSREPAAFEFEKIAVVDNPSLIGFDTTSDVEWARLEDCFEVIKQAALPELRKLKLHPDAEVGTSGRKTWYHRAIKIAGDQRNLR